MELRKFRPGDKDQVIKLWREVFNDDSPHNEPESVIKAKLKVDDLIFVAVLDGEIVGACMAGYDGHRGWLYAVAVSIKTRRSGIGTKLIKLTLKSLKELGCLKVNLQIRSTNKAVADFYKSLGFDIEDRLSMDVLL